MKFLLILSIFWIGEIFKDNSKSFQELKTDTPIGRVYYIHDEDADDSYGELIYPVGSADLDGTDGMAHYLEHLVVFNALPEDAQDAGRDINATTRLTLTNYYMNSENIEEILAYLAGTAEPLALDEDYAREEANIVKNEFNLRYSEAPYWPLQIEMMQSAFEGTGLSRSGIGRPEDIVNFDLKGGKEIHEKYYDLSKAILVVYSPLSARKVTKAINTAFANAQSRKAPDRKLNKAKLPMRDPDQQRIETDKIKGKTYNSLITLPVPEGYSDYEIETLIAFSNAVFSSSKDGMLTRKLNFETENFSDASVYMARLPGEMGIEIGLSGQANGDGEPEYLSAIYFDWLETLGENREIVEDVIHKTQNDYRKDFQDWTPEDQLGFLLSQIYANQERAPERFEAFVARSENMNADMLIEFLQNTATGVRVTDRIWEGKEN